MQYHSYTQIHTERKRERGHRDIDSSVLSFNIYETRPCLFSRTAHHRLPLCHIYCLSFVSPLSLLCLSLLFLLCLFCWFRSMNSNRVLVFRCWLPGAVLFNFFFKLFLSIFVVGRYGLIVLPVCVLFVMELARGKLSFDSFCSRRSCFW